MNNPILSAIISYKELVELRNSAKLHFSANELSIAESEFTALSTDSRFNAFAVRHLARINTRKSIDEVAIELWHEVLLESTVDREASLNLARLYLKAGKAELALSHYQQLQVIEVGNAECKKKIPELQRELRHHNAKPSDYQLNHIAIGGVSYSGSTLLSELFGVIEGVENVGETNWILRESSSGRGICSDCGCNCDVFTNNFRDSLKADDTNWYFKIAQRIGSHTLVSADKNVLKYKKLDPLLRMNVIVLFKSPKQAWYSNYRKIGSSVEEARPVENLEKYMSDWCRAYSSYLNNFSNVGKKLFLSYDSFSRSPESHMEVLCSHLGIKLDPCIRKSKREKQHRLGGSSGFNAQDKCARMEVRPTEAVVLPGDDLLKIESNAGVNDVYGQLLRHYQEDFREIAGII